MSTFLFLICANGFSALLQRKEKRGSLHGVCVVPGGLSVSHLFFADDAVVFCKAEETEVREVMEVLQCYAEASRQVINREKSSLYFGANYVRRRRKKLDIYTNIKGRDDFGKYLGITADFGSSKKVVFEGVHEALEGRTNGWAEQFLSLAGKEVLIKAVAIVKFWWRGNKDRRHVLDILEENETWKEVWRARV